MYAAHLAGIKVFVTGGIGGVHRGFEETMDVSADLEELAQTDVVVICAGAKAILDLPRTMEYLETKGVPVIGYRTDVLPAFFTAKSDIPLVERADSPEEIAKIILAKDQLEMRGGMLVVNPIPEEYSLDHEIIDQVIEGAVQAAQEQAQPAQILRRGSGRDNDGLGGEQGVKSELAQAWGAIDEAQVKLSLEGFKRLCQHLLAA